MSTINIFVSNTGNSNQIKLKDSEEHNRGWHYDIDESQRYYYLQSWMATLVWIHKTVWK